MLGGDYLISILVCPTVFLSKSFMSVCDLGKERVGGGHGRVRLAFLVVPVVPCITGYLLKNA